MTATPPPLDARIYAMQQRLALALEVPRWVVGLEPPPPPSRRERIARHVGQAGWRLGYTVSQAGRLLEAAGSHAGELLAAAGDRVIDGGDWLAGKVAGR